MSALPTPYHNPRRGKSCSVFDLLQERGVKAEVVRYLDVPPDLVALQDIFRRLGPESARDMMHVKDNLYQELGLGGPDLSDDTLLRVVTEHSALLERPILVTPDKAVIGRPFGNIGALLPEQKEAA